MVLDLLCLGEPMLEFNEQSDGRFLPGFGGDTSNCAIAAARQGAKSGIATLLGDDSFGSQFRQLWETEGVDTRAVGTHPTAPTGIYFVTHTDQGHDFSYYRHGSAASLLAPSDIPVDILRSTRYLHVSGISQAISASASESVVRAMEIVSDAGGKVSYDTNLRLKLWSLTVAQTVIHRAAGRSDIVLPGLDDARQLTGLSAPREIVDFYLNLGAEIVALTLGAEGTLVATRDECRHIAGQKVTPVDATAAGDTFDGAFLAQLAKGENPFDAAGYANVAAALSTQGYGAVAPMPSSEQVQTFLDQQVSQ